LIPHKPVLLGYQWVPAALLACLAIALLLELVVQLLHSGRTP
jgi:hypothetical protein